MNRFSTDFLVASGSMLIGMGSIFNVRGDYFLYNRANSTQAADALAISHDVAMVGQDIADVLASDATRKLIENS